MPSCRFASALLRSVVLPLFVFIATILGIAPAAFPSMAWASGHGIDPMAWSVPDLAAGRVPDGLDGSRDSGDPLAQPLYLIAAEAGLPALPRAAAEPSVTPTPTDLRAASPASAQKGSPDLAIELSTRESCFRDTARWEILVRNEGSRSLTDKITVVDSLPAQLAFLDASGDGWRFTVRGRVITAVHDGPLPVGGERSFVLRARLVSGNATWVENIVHVTGSGDRNHGNDRATLKTEICRGPDLSIDKRHVANFTVGAEGTFTIVVKNHGDRPTSGTFTVADTLPVGLSFVSGSGPGWTVGANGARINATHPGVLAAGDSTRFTITVAVAAAAVPAVVNFATVSGGGDDNPLDNRDGDRVKVRESGDLAIELTAPQSCFVDTANYDILVRNVGTTTLAGPITVLDTLANELAFIDAAGSGWSFTASGHVVTAVHAGPIAPGGSFSYRLRALVIEPRVPFVYHVARLIAAGDTNPENDRVILKVDLCDGPNLSIDKRHSEDFTVGTNGVFTFVVTNHGDAPTVGAFTVADTLPAGLTFVSGTGAGWTVGANGAVVTATHPGVLAVGDSTRYTVTVAVAAAAEPRVINAATVSGGGDIDPTDNRDVDIVPVSSAPDLAVAITHTNLPCVGDTAEFRVAVRNVGRGLSTGVITVVDTLPAGLSFAAGAGPGWTIAASGQVVSATHPGPLAAGDSLVFTFRAAVGAAAAPEVQVPAVVSGGGDRNPANNRDVDTLPVCARRVPNLSIDKRHSEDFTVGTNGVFTFVVTNHGDAPTVGAFTVADTLPAGLTFVSGTGAGWTVGANGAVVTATHPGVLAVGDSTRYTVTVAVAAAAEPRVINAATVSGGGDIDPTDNRDVDIVPVGSAPDLAVAITHTNLPCVGDTAEFRVAVRNVGRGLSTGVITVVDTLPAGLSFAAGAGPGWTIAASGQVVRATHPGPLAAGDSLVFTFRAAVGAAAAPEVQVPAVVSGGGDRNPANNRDVDTLPVCARRVPNLSIDKRHSEDFTVGTNGVFTFVVTNRGDAPTVGAFTVADTLPAGLTFVSGTGAGWTVGANGAVVTATHPGVLAVGDSTRYTVTVAVAAAAEPRVINAATVSGGGDIDPTDNRDVDIVPVGSAPDLAVAITHTNLPCVGDTAEFRVAVRNVGRGLSTGVITVVDTLPAGLSFAAGAGPGWTIAASGQVVSATHPGPLAAGDSLVFTFRAAVGAAAAPEVQVPAVVSGGGDRNPANNRDVDTLPVCARRVPNLSIDKRHSEDFTVGTNGVFTFVVTNRGDAPTVGAFTVADTLPAGLTFVSGTGAGWTVGANGAVVTATHPGVLAVGDSTRYTVTVAVAAAAEPRVINAATVSGGGDIDPTDNRDVDIVPVGGFTDLTITKIHTGEFVVGANARYTITVRNIGSRASIGAITVRDTLPVGLGFVQASGAWTFTTAGNIVTASTDATLTPGGTSSFDLVVAVGPAAVPEVINAAVVSGGGDSNPANNRAVDRAPVSAGAPPDMTIDKRHTEDFAVGRIGTYTLVMTNVGGTPTTGAVTVRDTLPAGLAFVSASGSGWVIDRAGAIVTAIHAAPIVPGDSASFNLRVSVSAAAIPAVINSATVSTPDDVNPANDRDRDPTVIAPAGRLVIEKRADPTEVEVGDGVDYTVLVKNIGGSSLDGVTVHDDLPVGLRYLPGTARLDGTRIADPIGIPGRSLTFAIGTVNVLQTRTLRYGVTVTAAAGLGLGVNVALAISAGDSSTTPVTPADTSNVASATIQIRPGPFAEDGIIVGKLFVDSDCDSNGVQGPEEIGIPGVRLYLEDGTSAVTDAEGKYSFPHVRPRLHVLRTDMSTLPPGAVLVPLSHRHALDGMSRFVDLRKGELHRADFATRHCTPELIAEIKLRRRAGEVSGAFVEGVLPVAAAGPDIPLGGGLALEPSSSTIPADGTSELPVRIHRSQGSPEGLITLESDIGSWTTPDEDPLTPGIQTRMTGEERVIGLRAPQVPGTGRIRVTAGADEDSASVTFVPGLRSLLMAGLVEGRLDWRRLRLAELCSDRRDDFEDQLRDASTTSDDGRFTASSRGALFAKGHVGGGTLLTLRYDSERDDDARRFRDIRPLEGYDIYGDASVHEYDARSTSRLYARLDRGASFAQFGDFVTPNAAGRQLGAFTRSLNGGLAHLGTSFVQVSAYGTQARERQVVDEIPAQGVSGPYALSRPDGVLGSEVVEILTRDRNQPARVLRRETRQRFTDYTIEPFTGRLLFRQPVPSLDRDLNPIVIRVVYEIESTGRGYGVYGGEATLTPLRRLTLGVGATRDEDPVAPRGLASAHVTFEPGAGLSLGAEVAHSDSGGALFDGASKGGAWRGHAQWSAGPLGARLYAQRTEHDFQNPSSGQLPGREELGADARLSLGSTSVFGRALRTEDLVSGGVRDGYEAGVGQRFGPLSTEVAYRWADESRTPATLGTVGPNEVSSVRGRVGAELPWTRRTTLFGEAERDIDHADADRYAIGGDMQLAPRTRLYVRHENIASSAGPFALNAFVDSRATTLIGFASDELQGGGIFTEYRARDAFAGREAQAAIGVRNRWLVADGLRLDGSLEDVRTVGGGTHATSVTSGIEYTRDPLWKGTARVEFRTESDLERWLASASLARKLARDWTALGRTTWFTTPDEERVDARTQVGLAWRQTERNAWDALARYENRFQKLGRGDEPFRRQANILASDVNWHPVRPLTLSGQVAAKWAIDEHGGSRTLTDAQLFGGRALVDIGPRLDLGLIGRGLYSGHFESHRTGLGAELGVIVARNLRLAAGYNVFGFREQDLADDGCTDRGPYLRFGLKFDEALFGRREVVPASAARPIAVATASAMTPTPEAELPSALTPLPGRTSDEVIGRDLAAIDGWQQKLDRLPGAARDPWRAAAARQWLEVARTEYTDNDETRFAEAAMEQAIDLIQAIATGSAPVGPNTVPAPRPMPGTERLRPDLWQKLEALKRDPNFDCAAEEIARMEVQLAWAGNERIDQKDCITTPHIREAESLAEQAADKEAACRTPVTPVTPAPVDTLDIGDLQIPRNVHFAFDQCVLSPESRAVIERVAAVMRRNPSLRVRLEGHTDIRGTSAYNKGLSECRVCAVRSALQELGVLDSRISGVGKGKTQLLATDRAKISHARNRRVEMVFEDANGRDIATSPQEGDLQLESFPAGPAKKAAPTFPSRRMPACFQ